MFCNWGHSFYTQSFSCHLFGPYSISALVYVSFFIPVYYYHHSPLVCTSAIQFWLYTIIHPWSVHLSSNLAYMSLLIHGLHICHLLLAICPLLIYDLHICLSLLAIYVGQCSLILWEISASSNWDNLSTCPDLSEYSWLRLVYVHFLCRFLVECTLGV